MPDDDPWGGPVDLEASDDDFWAEQRAQPSGPRRGVQTDPWFQATRAKANRVRCRDCLRGVGNNCVHVGVFPLVELKHFPAHQHRIDDAERMAQR